MKKYLQRVSSFWQDCFEFDIEDFRY